MKLYINSISKTKKIEKFFNLKISHKLIRGLVSAKGGRNNQGKITIRFKGGRHPRCFHLLDFKKILWNISGIIVRFDYDSLRTSLLSLICFSNGILSYNLGIQGQRLGDSISIGIFNNKFLNLKKGDCSLLLNLVDGFFISNIELYPLKGSQIVRSAGTVAQLIKLYYNQSNYALIKLPSKEERLFSVNCIATIGQICNINHFLIKFDCAGISRHLGQRSKVRGVAMNPIDHPHGGGQGKTSGAGGQRSQVTFKGKVAKGQKTRSILKINVYILVSRKKLKYIKS